MASRHCRMLVDCADRHSHKRSSFMTLFGITNTFDPMGLSVIFINTFVPILIVIVNDSIS